MGETFRLYSQNPTPMSSLLQRSRVVCQFLFILLSLQVYSLASNANLQVERTSFLDLTCYSPIGQSRMWVLNMEPYLYEKQNHLYVLLVVPRAE
ncbi:Uncharacterized protein TCM_021197 [Theobroma cacao]|uniref:Uncharacterized protein n=1 Tax=Theobroma cacao TaxID=3641 RepID=A0A061EQ61_THECC|nr:Uncharacterized protein TCM_021197 [Theobroma cacao]